MFPKIQHQDQDTTINTSQLHNRTHEALIKPEQNKQIRSYLIVCVILMSISSLQFGYNAASLSSFQENVEMVYDKSAFKIYYDLKAQFEEKKAIFIESQRIQNMLLEWKYLGDEKNLEYAERFIADRRRDAEAMGMTMQQVSEIAPRKLEDAKYKLEAVRILLDKLLMVLWGMLNSTFAIGGLIGALIARPIARNSQHKRGMLVHYCVSACGSILIIVAFYFEQRSLYLVPLVLLVSRILFGVQAGMATIIVPSYMREIIPDSMRSSLMIIPSAAFSIGLVMAHLLSFKPILGKEDLWLVVSALSIIPAFIGMVVWRLLPEVPKCKQKSRADMLLQSTPMAVPTKQNDQH